jgi:hypothetical protein
LNAIDRFLKGEKVEGTYEGKDLGRDFAPEKFRPES